MKELIERFYHSIRTNGLPPIPYREVMLTARIMDEIFGQIYPNRTTEDGRQTTENGERDQSSEIRSQRTESKPVPSAIGDPPSVIAC